MGLTDFFEAIQGSVSRAFIGIEKFLLQIQLVGINTVEVILFLVFFAIVILLLLAPMKAHEYLTTALAPFKRFVDWMKR